MTTTHQHPSQEEKRRLRRQVRQTAQDVLDSDNINGGAEILAGYRQRYAQSSDNYLRFGLAVIFIEYLLSHCCVHQAKQVTYLLDEHLEYGSWQNSRLIMMSQLKMWRRFRDTKAEEACYVNWQAKNTTRHESH